MAGQRIALREGFTTGTAASAAALAGLIHLLTGEKPPSVRVPLPPFDPNPRSWMEIPIQSCHLQQQAACATVIKDGGDDPDVTNGAAIEASVKLVTGTESPRPVITLAGGKGVGRVTLPGLPVPVGESAINPTPREQICQSIWLWLAEQNKNCHALDIIISVPDGERLASKTFNPRLGIMGGISILGTQGTVRPYSHDAFRATIAQGLHVAKSLGLDSICLTTGRRSERLLMDKMPRLPVQAFVQVADFAYFALNAAGNAGFAHIHWGCFFGKLLKLAQGNANTHAHQATQDMSQIIALCQQQNMPATATEIACCTTAAQALDILLDARRHEHGGTTVIRALVGKASQVATSFAGQPVIMHLFHIDGRYLA